MIAHDPLHGSGQAALPHPALGSGNDAHATQGMGMTDRRQWQPAVDKAPHAIPRDATVLTAPRQRALPEPAHLGPKQPQRHRVSDHAGLWHTSRYRSARFCLSPTSTASASRRVILTGLSTRPARSPVNASRPPLQAAPHDSGPTWVATLLSYDFFIHYTSPICRRTEVES